MQTLSIDIETYSDVNLSKCGVYKYAESPDFEILLFGYSADSSEVTVIDLAQGERLPQEIIDLVPFNHLRNSRADSGLSYWQNSGFTVDADNGVSGSASFKCEGALNTTKSLSQTITPANRQCYTFSAQIASENLSKGTNGQVGIEVTFEYEDGTTETRFIDLI